MQSVCPLYSAAYCGRISVVDECAAPGQKWPGAGRAALCIAGKTVLDCFFCPGAISIASGHFYLPGCRIGPLWERVGERAYDLVAVKENVSPFGPSGHLPHRGRLSQHETIITNEK